MKKIRVLTASLLISFPLFAQDYLSEQKSGYTGGFIPALEIVDESLNFIVMGDFGRNGQYFQKGVADQMGKAAMTLGSEFTLSMGDNFYPNGVQSTQDSQWNSSFENIYTNHSLYDNWYIALGNHDYRGNIQAQIDYSKVSRRWTLPANYYSKTIALEDGNKLLLVVMDTNPFIDGYYKKGSDMYENIIAQDTTAQRKWLTETLSTTDASIKWKMVVGHHPLYSGGKRKESPDTKSFEKKFASFFDKHKVDAYLCGHEHDFQIIKPKGRYTTQFLTGSACEVRPTGKREGTVFAAAEPGFMAFSVTDKKLVVQAINEKGIVLYKTEINK